jgi:hypothetical protein
MNQALSVGIYCATTFANTPVIYALGLDLVGGTAGYKLFAIQPRIWTVAEARKSN